MRDLLKWEIIILATETFFSDLIKAPDLWCFSQFCYQTLYFLCLMELPLLQPLKPQSHYPKSDVNWHIASSWANRLPRAVGTTPSLLEVKKCLDNPPRHVVTQGLWTHTERENQTEDVAWLPLRWLAHIKINPYAYNKFLPKLRWPKPCEADCRIHPSLEQL